MGQLLLSTLKQQIHSQSPENQTAVEPQTLLSTILQQAEDLTGHPLTSQDIHQHILNYLETQSQPPEDTRRRRRSYELLHKEDAHMEEPSPSQEELTPRCKML